MKFHIKNYAQLYMGEDHENLVMLKSELAASINVSMQISACDWGLVAGKYLDK
jgi:hypothetical protein